MEEDIKALRDYLDSGDQYDDYHFSHGYGKHLENLLKRYKELEEENKKLKTIKGFEEENIEVSKFGEWVGKDYIDYKFEYENYQKILADSIPISFIEKEIEYYKKYGKHVIHNGLTGENHKEWIEYVMQEEIDILEGLLKNYKQQTK